MNRDHDIRSDLEPDTPEELIRLAQRLQQERPVPAATFRGDLRRRLLAGGRQHSRPKRLRMLITAYATGGAALLLVGAASVVGIGPLGA